MSADDTAQLAKIMKVPEDALRAARLPEEKVFDILRRTRSATRKVWIGAMVALVLFIGSIVVASNRAYAMVGLALFVSSFLALIWVALIPGPRKITAEAAEAMHRRLVELDRRDGAAKANE